MSVETIRFDYDVFSENDKKKFYYSSFENKPVQSVCYDTKNNVYIVGFSQKDNDALGTLVKMRDLKFTDDSVLEVKADLPLGHCNDLEYDPVLHQIYVARGDKNIAIVDPDSMEVIDYIFVDVYAWAVSMYNNGDLFIHDGISSFRYYRQTSEIAYVSYEDTEWIVKEFDIPYNEREVCYEGYWQGSVMIDDIPYMIYTDWSSQGWYFKSCMLVPCDGDRKKPIYQAPTGCETEGACIINNRIKFVYGQKKIGGAEWDMNEIMFKMFHETIKKVDVPVNTNVDISVAQFVPRGYELVSANIQFKKSGSTWRAIPSANDAGKMIMRILRVANNKITIRSNEAFSGISLQITGFCKKIN